LKLEINAMTHVWSVKPFGTIFTAQLQGLGRDGCQHASKEVCLSGMEVDLVFQRARMELHALTKWISKDV
jgi:hypothetical protein